MVQKSPRLKDRNASIPEILDRLFSGKRVDEVTLRNAKAEYDKLKLIKSAKTTKPLTGEERQRRARGRPKNSEPMARFNMKLTQSELTAWNDACDILKYESLSAMVRFAVNGLVNNVIETKHHVTPLNQVNTGQQPTTPTP
jgi:hypothetical protein